MDSPYQGSADVHVLPTNISLPGVGVLPINAYLIMAEEPVLIDSDVAVDADQFIDAVSSIIDLGTLKWVWPTHDDADHREHPTDRGARAEREARDPWARCVAHVDVVSRPDGTSARHPVRRRHPRR